MTRFSVVGIALFLTLAADAGAQQPPAPLFSPAEVAVADRAAAAMNARSAKPVLDRRVVSMDLGQLFDPNVRRVLLNVGDHEWVAAFERLDNINGSRAWTGSIEGIPYSHVSIVENDGAVAGLINAVGELYAIQTVTPGVFTLDRIADANKERQPIVPEPMAAADAPPAPGLAADDGTLIDVLILYTPAAATAAGSQGGIAAVVAKVISDTNTAYQRSGITTRMRLVGSTQLAFSETTNMTNDLIALRANATAAALRNSTGADIVLLLEDSIDLDTCGIAYLLTAGNATTFAPNAFAVADIYVGCVYTPSHEMGHNQGSNHDPANASGGGAFDFSYGFRDEVAGFRTVMAYDDIGCCPRILNFSNPVVLYNGHTTGKEKQNNASSIQQTAVVVANFKQALGGGVTVPPAPTGLAASTSGFNATVSWAAVAGAAGYALDVGTASGVYNIFSQLNVGNQTSVSGSGPAATYFFRVRAYNSAGPGAPSAESSFSLPAGCAIPGAPPSFTHSVGANRLVTLAWGVPTGSGPFAYTIDVGLGSGQTLVSLPAGAVNSVSVQAPPGTFFVRIRASNICGTGGPSVERTIAVP